MALLELQQNISVFSITLDWLYPTYQSQEIVSALTANVIDVKYEEIRSQYVYDAFLLEEGQMNYLIRGFLSQILVKDIINQNFYSVFRDETIENVSILMVKRRLNIYFSYLKESLKDCHLLGYYKSICL